MKIKKNRIIVDKNITILVGLFVSIVLFLGDIYAYPQQKIKDFYLSNVTEDGSNHWEVKGQEALVYDGFVDITDMEANYSTEKDNVFVTSKEAKLNKENMDIQLNKDVYVKNQDGVTLTTESLNWKKRKNQIETKEFVKTGNDSLQITATGMNADTQLKEADFGKDVEAVVLDEKNKNPTTITCDGSLEIEYVIGKAVFNKNVIVTNNQGKLFSDKATLFFDSKAKAIIKIVSEGNVKIVRDDNVTFAQKAVYLGKEQKLVLEGKPRLIYFPQEDDNFVLY
ncbi:MAG: LPS export ABC transporter periplasmic protein LptC [Candidatus Omnitrophica bacterium]|nr:LPS export ABC transporter periplasmic protein LptC [Candidatus Omnitrophota bacterium]